MNSSVPHLFRQGPLEAYIKPIPSIVDLASLVCSLGERASVVWLDSARPNPVTGRWSVLGWDPWLTLSARESRITLRSSKSTRYWRANPFDALRDTLRAYAGANRESGGLPGFGFLGYLGYDLNRWIERLPFPRFNMRSKVPDMVWHGMRMTILVDHMLGCSWLISMVDPYCRGTRARRLALNRLERCQETLHVPARPARKVAGELALSATTSQIEFEEMVSRVLECIRAGEIFQANVAHEFVASWKTASLPLYLALRKVNPSPFACWLSWDDFAVVSCSPERLVQVEDGLIATRPIAGTRPRGRTPQEDATNSFELLMSDKERAEHVMLVDLSRNDLGRVCLSGSISVDEFMALEEYSHVIHIVSNVSGQLRAKFDAVDIIRAIFPGGTITGCPKVRCMEILSEVEPIRRGLYTGSIGRLGFNGAMDLNIAIRTMVISKGQLSFHVGSGIVADSKPDREYSETLAKAGALVDALRVVSAREHKAYAQDS